MSKPTKLQRLEWFIWPPSEAEYAKPYLEKQINENSHLEVKVEELRERLTRVDIAEFDSSETFLDWAKSIYESENKRREILESKATTYISVFSFVSGLVALIPALFTSQWNIPVVIACIVALLYILAVIYLFTSIFYAVQVREVSEYSFPTFHEFEHYINDGKYSTTDGILRYWRYVKYNEPRLIIKSNNLSVAETTFIRGIILSAVAFSLVGITKLVNAPMLQSTEYCQVPNLVGVEEVIAEQVAKSLPLSVEKQFVYDSNIPVGVVISQSPDEGQLLSPCSGVLQMNISLGEKPTLTMTPTSTKTFTFSSTPTIKTTQTPKPTAKPALSPTS